MLGYYKPLYQAQLLGSLVTANLKQQVRGGGRGDGARQDKHVRGNENWQRKSIRTTKPERISINV